MPTSLSELINRANVWTPIYSMDEVRKVNAIDQSLRTLRRSINPPWSVVKTTLKVVKDVPLYPTPSDFAGILLLSSSKEDASFGEQPRYVFTSYKDFIEKSSYRSLLAEVWENHAKMLAVRDQVTTGQTSVTLNTAEDVSEWAGSGDAGTPVLDNVVYKTGNGSIRVPVTSLTTVATVTLTYDNTTTDTNYRRKYYQRWVYFDSVPTSVELRLRVNATNYLAQTVTTQHAGQAFVADDWNLLQMDLNTATETGDVSSGIFASEVMILNGAATGTYYFDSSFLRGWVLEDFRYYSTYNVADTTQTTFADHFAPDSATYTLTDVLLGDTRWDDVVLYEAAAYLLADQKEGNLFQLVDKLKNDAWAEFFKQYPDLSPRITTQTYRFEDDYRRDMITTGDDLL